MGTSLPFRTGVEIARVEDTVRHARGHPRPSTDPAFTLTLSTGCPQVTSFRHPSVGRRATLCPRRRFCLRSQLNAVDFRSSFLKKIAPKEAASPGFHNFASYIGTMDRESFLVIEC